MFEINNVVVPLKESKVLDLNTDYNELKLYLILTKTSLIIYKLV